MKSASPINWGPNSWVEKDAADRASHPERSPWAGACGKSGLWRKRPKLLCHLSEKMVIFHVEFIVALRGDASPFR